jgi:hypothetical protein
MTAMRIEDVSNRLVRNTFTPWQAPQRMLVTELGDAAGSGATGLPLHTHVCGLVG